MPDRSLPAPLIDGLRELDVEGLVALYLGRFSEAERIFKEQYNMIAESQTSLNRSIHKGGPLHNLGITLISEGRNEEGLHDILLAYVEDTLNVLYGDEDEVDRYPAGVVLRDSLRIKLRFLAEVKRLSAKLKS